MSAVEDLAGDVKFSCMSLTRSSLLQITEAFKFG